MSKSENKEHNDYVVNILEREGTGVTSSLNHYQAFFRVIMTTSICFSPRMFNLTVTGFTLLHIGLAKVERIILYVDNV